MFTNEDKIAINEIRCFCADMVQTPSSGHPGSAIGMTPLMYVLHKHFARLTPKDPFCFARDKVILSNGHVSSLFYTILHLCGFDYTLDDLKKARTFGTKCPALVAPSNYETG